ncbi:DJ-1 family glyoxalase III [Limosilactobacillus mucosae]|uniref:DJ-1 family glyoxalase III n=1 Tax=Limosilactobacillus mucosae TaxID=97478 RepID=UPI0022E73561|nr:DJ-1 family glyoxalase III [Limosilactobacillus mucosae]
MTKLAVVFANGCEEIEGLTQIDVFRRLGVQADVIGLDSLQINGDHDIKLTCDGVVDQNLLDYDCVIFPGGVTGANNLRDSDQLMKIMRERQAAGKWNAAMCTAPIAFARYGLLDNHDYTCYPGFNKQADKDAQNAHFKEDITVVDKKGHVITSRGPATAMTFAFCIADTLGLDTTQLREGMLYNFLAKNI